MEDTTIIELYWRRSEAAIPATAEKYSAYCASIARGILGSPEDTEECLNDTWLGAWNAIPPHRPAFLAAFLGKITRNLAINRRQAARAEKRGGGTLPAVLEELEEIVSGTQSPEDALVRQELLDAIGGFLSAQPVRKRQLFVMRYFETASVSELARRFGMRENAVSMALGRLRKQLKAHLLERGFDL